MLWGFVTQIPHQRGSEHLDTPKMLNLPTSLFHESVREKKGSDRFFKQNGSDRFRFRPVPVQTSSVNRYPVLFTGLMLRIDVMCAFLLIS